MSKGVQIAIGAVLIALLVGWFGLSSMDEYQYLQTLHEFQAQGREGERARVHGYVQTGSIQRDLESKTVSFAIVNDPPHAGVSTPGAPLAIVYDSLETPDLFKDGAEVVVEGHLKRGDGTARAGDRSRGFVRSGPAPAIPVAVSCRPQTMKSGALAYLLACSGRNSPVLRCTSGMGMCLWGASPLSENHRPRYGHRE